MTDYFDTLAARLREHGIGPEEVRDTLDDLAAFAAESGADPHAEFGPAQDFARQLAAARGTEQDPPDSGGQDTWHWSADVFTAPRKLAEFGAQGWEMEGVDRLGAFICRRDPGNAQQWEYRQEVADSGRGRAALAERLAPEGWEPCGHWSVFTYFKRPRAASTGPEARVADPPAAPRRRFFLGWSFVGLALVAVFIAVRAVMSSVSSIREYLDGPDAAAELAGWAVGAVVGVGGALLTVWGVLALVARMRSGQD